MKKTETLKTNILLTIWGLSLLLTYVYTGCSIPDQNSIPTEIIHTNDPPLCIGTTCFDAVRLVDQTPVPIRGAGRYITFGTPLYTAALYAPAGDLSTEEILGAIPKCLILHFHRPFSKNEFIDTLESQFSLNTDLNKSTIQDRLDRMYLSLKTTQKGDRYEFSFYPNAGTLLRFNGIQKCFIAGDDFGAALFGLWLSSDCFDHSLRDQLMNAASLE